MGEIKSTLDLVMEKTKHMTLSEDERIEQKRHESLKKIQGWLQQYSDQLKTVEDFKLEWDRMKTGDSALSDRLICREILKKITLGKDNDKWLALLENICDIYAGKIVAILSGYDASANAMADEMKRNLAEALAKKGISGTAVVPNLDAHTGWISSIRELEEGYEVRLEKVLDNDN